MTEPTIVLINVKPEELTCYKVGELLVIHYNPQPTAPTGWTLVELIKHVGPIVSLLVKVLSWLGRH